MARGGQVESLWNGILDNSGEMLNGGKVYTYTAGTTTPKSLYTDSACATPAANPVVLDAYGRAFVYGSGSYKFVVKTSADVTIETLDGLYYDGTEWITWTPTISGDGTAVLSSLTITRAKYYLQGKICFFQLEFTVTMDVATASAAFSLPVTAASASGIAFSGSFVNAGGYYNLTGFLFSNSIAIAYKYDNNFFGNGAHTYKFSGFYEAA